MGGPTVYDHYRPTNGTTPPGVYRVVGTGEEVTLLRVADENGRRVHSGVVESVRRERVESAFVPATNPDAGAGGWLPRALAAVGVGFVVVAGLSWVGVFTTPASPTTLAAIGVLLFTAGRVVDRFGS
jgi:hypothetical protein